MRMGVGYDSHRFGAGNAIRLGGISIPHDRALIGHSDADAIAHAVTDALLGAAGQGDIGSMFPDNDPANQGRDSIEMLTIAMAPLRDRGRPANNADLQVVPEAPRAEDPRGARGAWRWAWGAAPRGRSGGRRRSGSLGARRS